MYILPQAGKLGNDLQSSRLDKFGYYPCQYTPGLWNHKWRSIAFSMVVGNFGVKFEGIKHAQHLKEALKTYHKVSLDWKGKRFCGASLEWDYKGRMVDLSMPGYINKALPNYQHYIPSRPKHHPYKSTPIQYGAKVQQIV